ncbi:processive 1,2-diacylglycerol beta-glucosyltransferase [Selenomonas sp. GACV-9]|uniref:MGDG synthase family glycosyltransferase n=1 Tax=Selenomonas sp. GACV-9 TaxID=3158782 RepID=UPI0008DF820A|nr:processive 1,2-diacylglycerol beta-glucosyltransferase [Selenomonas ruminantium]
MRADRILILTASIGSGHIKAAEAVAKEMQRQLPEADLVTVDFMSRETSLLHWLMKKAYLVMLAFVPNLYDVFYKVSGGQASGSLVQKAFAIVMQPVVKRLLLRYEPTAVICTHPFPEGAVSLWKRRQKSSLPLAVVMTDYSLHQIWLYPQVDQYFMATEAMKAEMTACGFAADTLLAAGIPVDSGLRGLPGKEVLRKQLDIPDKQPAVLLMGGGLGLGGIASTLQALEKLPQRLTLLVIAGRNERLQAEVRAFARTSRHQVRLWGYTDKAHELMRAADLLITKPGALTISEAFVLGLPMLLHDPIPGPETENAVYATRHGAAVWLHPGEKLAPAVRELFAEDCLTEMSERALACARPEAAAQIAQAVAVFIRGVGTGKK